MHVLAFRGDASRRPGRPACHGVRGHVDLVGGARREVRARRRYDRRVGEAGQAAEDEATVAFENVRALRQGIVLLCEVDGKRVGVLREEIGAESEVQKPGDFGRLVITRRHAIDLRLMDERGRRRA